jgi:hypothetical protein
MDYQEELSLVIELKPVQNTNSLEQSHSIHFQ